MALDKDWIKDHKKEIIVGGVMTIISVAGGVYIYRLDARTRTYKSVNDILRGQLTTTEQKCNTLMAAASEGLFEEAIATTTRKLNYRKDQLKFLGNARHKGNTQNKDVVAKMTAITNEIDVLVERLSKFRDAQQLYEISDVL